MNLSVDLHLYYHLLRTGTASYRQSLNTLDAEDLQTWMYISGPIRVAYFGMDPIA